MAKEKVEKQNTKRIKVADIKSVDRFSVPQNQGLTEEMVAERQEQGLVNVDATKHGKTIGGIIVSNVFTFFNMIYVAIAIVLLCYGQYANMSFMLVILANTLIAIIQEIRSKKTLDKLRLVSVPSVKVMRGGAQIDVPVTEIVLDDVVSLASGNQVSCDSVILSGGVEVNESILTGESEAVVKNVGDTLYAGSVIVSGSCVVRVDKVGKYNYIAGLTGRAKRYRKPDSEMLGSLRTILIFVAIIVIPMAACLWAVNYEYWSDPASWGTVTMSERGIFINTLNKTAGSIISMIPAGPFLLTSVALAVSVIRLSSHNTIVQELYCIEMLARVDCLCLDKTGTITDGTMSVVDCIDLRPRGSKYTLREIMGSFNAAQGDENMTGKALRKYFGKPSRPPLTKVSVLPFSSARKLSAVSFEGNGTYMLGAPEFVLNSQNSRVNELVQKYAAEGLRVLVLAHSVTSMFGGKNLPAVRRPVAVIVIEDRIRKDAAETISWFVQNGVDIKVISGDNAATVSNIAMRVGIARADKYISLEGMSEEQVANAATQYTVFGRVSPDQKAILVKALKAAGHTVAMTGDGVNDILAMKESDCSISLAGGSDAARNVAHLVLRDDSFSNLPAVVAEGRRVVNNIQNSTSMYFMKTVYVIVINIMLIIAHFALNTSVPSPYETVQIFLLETVVVGLPTTILALQPNNEVIKGRFLTNVLRRCLPASLAFIASTVSLYLVKYLVITDMTGDELSTLVSISYTCGGFFALYFACKPFNKWKAAMYAGVGLVVGLGITLLPHFWRYATLSRELTLLLLVEILALPMLLSVNFRVGAMLGKKSLNTRKRTPKQKT